MTEIRNGIQNIFSNSDITIGNIPLSKIIIVAVLMLLILGLKSFFTQRIIKVFESWTAKTETELDDEFIASAKKPLGWLIILAGISLSQLILEAHLSPNLNEILAKWISLFFIIIIGTIIYRASKLIGYVFGLIADQTDIEFDDLFVPYVPLFVETVVVVVVLIKASNILLGASAGALIGLLGGAGVAIGLICKDIIYDWCCTVIIYSDQLYRPGQWLTVDGINGFVKVLNIGLRSTKLWIYEYASIKQVPNSKMIAGVVENWDQNRSDTLEWGLTGTLKIDFISADQSSRIFDGLQELLGSVTGIIGKPIVLFKGLEGNARVFKYIAYLDPNAYFPSAKKINMEILRLLEREGIDSLNVYLVTDPKTNKEIMAQVNALN